VVKPTTVERQSIGSVTSIALSDQVSWIATDLLLAITRSDFLRVADHLRLLSQDVERFVEKMEQ
jgi:hypothetical protein